MEAKTTNPHYQTPRPLLTAKSPHREFAQRQHTLDLRSAPPFQNLNSDLRHWISDPNPPGSHSTILSTPTRRASSQNLGGDERAARHAGGTMTGGSLSIRTPSYGSLQQHQLLYNNTAAVLPSPPLAPVVRKPPKMLPPGAREKERVLAWICRPLGRRKVAMLMFLVTLAAAVLTLLSSSINRDDDASASPERTMTFSDQLMSSMNHITLSPVNLTPPPVVEPVIRRNITLEHHPCENFSLPVLQQETKRIGPRPCPVCYAPVDLAVALMPATPFMSPVLKHLSYVLEEDLVLNETSAGSMFGGYPTLEERAESFNIKESMSVHCGFVKGRKPGLGTGFDIDEVDLLEMEQCLGVVVASAIFGNYDIMQQPRNISEAAKETVCFYMLVDEETEAYIRNTSNIDRTSKVGLWRVVVVRNLPYIDARRNGKVPKLLLHRLFPNARFSLWIDGKLELVVDPYQVLERFLWRQNASFAISRHYRRFDVFVEAEANKAAGKYENASIDYQIAFYKREGLTPYSIAKLPITSDVPEGCVIIREHTPITNLFTCLWFNEVDRFTSRDQLSFSTVRDKIMSKVNWTVNMFLDCERRNFVVQAYHRDLLEQRKALVRRPVLKNESPEKLSADSVPERTARSPPTRRRGRDRKSNSRRRHPKATAGI